MYIDSWHQLVNIVNQKKVRKKSQNSTPQIVFIFSQPYDYMCNDDSNFLGNFGGRPLKVSIGDLGLCQKGAGASLLAISCFAC